MYKKKLHVDWWEECIVCISWTNEKTLFKWQLDWWKCSR